LVGKPEETTGRSKYRCEDNIRMDVKEIGWEGVDSMHLVQNWDLWLAVVDMVMNSRVL
jgi:hypothetical protein